MGDLNDNQIYRLLGQDQYIWFGLLRPIWYLNEFPGEETDVDNLQWQRAQTGGPKGIYWGFTMVVVGTPAAPVDGDFIFSGHHENWAVFDHDTVAWHMWRDPSDGLYYVTLDDRFTHAGDEEWWVADLPDMAERPYAPGGTASGTLDVDSSPDGVATVT